MGDINGFMAKLAELKVIQKVVQKQKKCNGAEQKQRIGGIPADDLNAQSHQNE
jgi:hypothetical protein